MEQRAVVLVVGVPCFYYTRKSVILGYNPDERINLWGEGLDLIEVRGCAAK